ncbi:hypothetical protein A4G20_09310 [Pasteurellaceae bacterium RH1A]|nr:hypothetical protein A4G20_09310 [Pasteurellaceae bacterium RH1A]
MAKLRDQQHILEITPTGHYYVTDGSDTNEFYYVISIYKEGQKQAYPLGEKGELLTEFDVETMDFMISKTCFDAIQEHKEDLADDLFNGGFALSFIPTNNIWKVKLELWSRYSGQNEEVILELNVSEDDLFDFGRNLRAEESSAMAEPRKVIPF